MADRMSTRIRYDRIRDNSAISRTVNGHKKRKERVARDARMKKLITLAAALAAATPLARPVVLPLRPPPRR